MSFTFSSGGGTRADGRLDPDGVAVANDRHPLPGKGSVGYHIMLPLGKIGLMYSYLGPALVIDGSQKVGGPEVSFGGRAFPVRSFWVDVHWRPYLPGALLGGYFPNSPGMVLCG